MFWSRALSTASRRRGFADASGPPSRDETVISLIRRVKILPRLASARSFLCLMFAHLLWPAIVNLDFALSGPGRRFGINLAILPKTGTARRSAHALHALRVKRHITPRQWHARHTF